MLTLTLRQVPTLPLEAPILSPDRLVGKSLAEIETLPLLLGNRTVTLGDWFAVSGDSSMPDLTIIGDCGRVKSIGVGMGMGTLTIHGSGGMHVGAAMVGGRLEVHGDVGDWAGAEMFGGSLHIHGRAGSNAGGAYRGSRKGMRGGMILIDGDAGPELGALMRRGLIAVGGNVGDYAGNDLIAGTIALFGEVGIRCGAGVKRGSIVSFGGAIEMIGTYAFDCEYEPVYPMLLQKHLREVGFEPARKMPQPMTRFRRYSGDRLIYGKGEMLIGLG